MKIFRAIVFPVMILAAAAAASGGRQIFPGQAPAEISNGIIEAYDAALERDFGTAERICRRLGDRFPQSPAGPTGLMVLYQVMMLENDDYEREAEFLAAAQEAVARASVFAESQPQNDWHYTLLGATHGVRGIYCLRKKEYLTGIYHGARGLRYMQTAKDMSPENYEARLGIGVFLYYRSAYADILPVPWPDQRELGISEVIVAGQNRPYLNEVSRIALFYIYLDKKEYDTAFAYIDGLIAGRPDFPIFLQFAGRAMYEKGDYRKALDYYLAMHEIDPQLHLPYLRIAQCLEKLGEKREAEKWLDGFHRALGDRPSVHRQTADDLRLKLDKT